MASVLATNCEVVFNYIAGTTVATTVQIDERAAVFTPSDQIRQMIGAVTSSSVAVAGMRTMLDRESEFDNPWQAKLAGIGLDPAARTRAERQLDITWAVDSLGLRETARLDVWDEVIIGGGFHAAVYAAARVLAGFNKPLVLERSDRVGGTFAVTERPTFFLNSRNRAGKAGLAGDMGAGLNYLPGAPIQAANISMTEYQTNADMAYIIRLTLAQYAKVMTGATVGGIDSAQHLEVSGTFPGRIRARRVIDARGMGDPVQLGTNGTTILTFPQFLRRMAGEWPLRGLRRVAIVGDGDSAKCAAESLLGIGPQPWMGSAALDSVERIDWYATGLPVTCKAWQREVTGRYQAVGRHLRKDRFGRRRISMVQRLAYPLPMPDGTALIDGRTYDMVVACAGYSSDTPDFSNLGFGTFDLFRIGDTRYTNPVARRSPYAEIYQIGPRANLPFSAQEASEGVAFLPRNAVSMFRTASKTAALAMTLPAPA